MCVVGELDGGEVPAYPLAPGDIPPLLSSGEIHISLAFDLLQRTKL